MLTNMSINPVNSALKAKLKPTNTSNMFTTYYFFHDIEALLTLLAISWNFFSLGSASVDGYLVKELTAVKTMFFCTKIAFIDGFLFVD